MPNNSWTLAGKSASSRCRTLPVRLVDGFTRIYVCDLPSKYDALEEKYRGASPPRLSSHLALLAYFRPLDVPAITVLRDGHLVSRSADFIMYSVEAEFIDNVVAQYGPCEFLPSSGL